MDPWPILPLAFGLALMAFLGAWAVRRRRAKLEVRVAPPPSHHARAIPIVPQPTQEALMALPRPIHACPECGYIGIRPLGVLDDPSGGGLASTQACPHCGYRGPPAEFDTGDDYAEYVEGLHRAWRAKK